MTIEEQIRVLGSLKQGALCALLPLSDRQIVRRRPPRNEDGLHTAEDVVAWFVKAEIASALAAARAADPMGDGAISSPALEKYREHRAELEGLRVAKAKRQQVDLSELNALWAMVAARIRSFLGRLRVVGGEDAVALVEKAIEEIADEIEKQTAESEGDA